MTRISMPQIVVPLAFLAAFFSLAAPSSADRERDRDRDVVVPQVTGRDVDRAIQDLEAAGLAAVVVEVADAPEGRVAAQNPERGTRVEVGSPVEIRVGVMVRIETRVPSVLGWEVERAVRALSGAYVVEVEEVRVDAAREGTVLETIPAPGARHAFRGVLVLRVAVVPDLAFVPRVEGLRLEQAERALIGAGLTALPTFVPAWGVPPDTVLQQNPRAGSQVEVGTQVALTVAAPRRRQEIRVPNLFGLTEPDASRVLAGLGLSAQIERVPARAAEGRVFRQEPDAGVAVRAGTPIRLAVAVRRAGPVLPRGIPVPNLVGMDAAAARLVLVQAGLGAQMRLEEAPEGAVDQVYAQEPAAGLVVPEGTRVVFLLPAPADVPDVIGRGAGEVQALLAAAGLRAAFEAGRPDPRAVAAVQSPEPGMRVARGSVVRVSLAVNVGVRRTPVPSVVGLTASDAQAALAAVGLVGVLDGPRMPPQFLAVAAQDPAPGTFVPRGSEIRLRVVPGRR